MVEHCYAECHETALNAMCQYAECHYAECRGVGITVSHKKEYVASFHKTP
jgi:hypothetical protein